MRNERGVAVAIARVVLVAGALIAAMTMTSSNATASGALPVTCESNTEYACMLTTNAHPLFKCSGTGTCSNCCKATGYLCSANGHEASGYRDDSCEGGGDES